MLKSQNFVFWKKLITELGGTDGFDCPDSLRGIWASIVLVSEKAKVLCEPYNSYRRPAIAGNLNSGVPSWTLMNAWNNPHIIQNPRPSVCVGSKGSLVTCCIENISVHFSALCRNSSHHYHCSQIVSHGFKFLYSKSLSTKDYYYSTPIS